MRGALGSEVARRPPGSHNAQSPIRFQGQRSEKQPEVCPPASVGNRQFREAGAFPAPAKKQPSAYLTGAFTGGGKGSA